MYHINYRYMNGALTNPDAHVFAYAAAQVKKGLDIAKKLGAENFGKIQDICIAAVTLFDLIYQRVILLVFMKVTPLCCYLLSFFIIVL